MHVLNAQRIMATITFSEPGTEVWGGQFIYPSSPAAGRWQKQNLNPSQTDSKANGMFVPLLIITYMVRKYSAPFLVRKDGAKESGAWALGRGMVFMEEVRIEKRTGLGWKMLSYIMASEVNSANKTMF